MLTAECMSADLSTSVFVILIHITTMKKYEIHCRSTHFVKNW